MVLKQLYYTSCEVGLSGYPGFQFNAASRGVAPEVMRRVESFTAYDPPGSLPYNADAAALAACPVNLCFEPAEDTGVLANVVFVGTDYSNRFGNYFAHALVSEDVATDLGEALPIELWGAPIWTASPKTDGAELPELAGPPPRGRLDRRHVAAFLRTHPGRAALPALVSAAARVITGERRTIVLIERDSGAAANWIGAVSYLLPPALARRMSFATYHHRPAYSDLHLVATVPDADVDRGDGAFASFLQFDIPANRSSQVPVEPWAALLAETGVENAAELWAAAAELGGGLPVRSGEWHPLLAAALFRHGHQASGAGPAVTAAAATAARWLGRQAPSLDARTIELIGVGALGVLAGSRPPGTGAALTALAAAAAEAGAAPLATEIEKLAVDIEVDGLLAHEPVKGAGGAEAVPLRSPAGRAHATDRCTRALRRCTAEVAVDLLLLAARERLDLDSALLRTAGERVVGPRLLAEPTEATARLARGWPQLRAGVVHHLAAVAAREPDRLVEALTHGLGEALDDDDTRAAPALHEARLIAASRRDPRLRIDMLAEIAMLRASGPESTGTPAVDADLLRRVWPHGSWTPGEALRALEVLDEASLNAPATVAWLNAVLTREWPATAAADGDHLEDLEALCHAFEGRPAASRLSDPARATITRMTTVRRRLAAATGPGRQAAVLTAGLDRMPETQRAHHLSKLTDLLNKAPAGDLPEIFASCPAEAVEHYLLDVDTYLRADRAQTDIAGRLFYAVVILRRNPSRKVRVVATVIEDRLLDRLITWHWQDLRALHVWIRKLDPAVATDFANWRDLNAAGWLRRTLTRRRLEKEADAPRRAAEKKARAERKAAAEKKAAAAQKAADKKRSGSGGKNGKNGKSGTEAQGKAAAKKRNPR
ncbi:hypothetical protein Franean1_7001 [Parafrankia sp. EAN1pec]|uniref:GTPase-associated protein 1-related protein n=1 Tax=Parafrankia sp. (strain EAN1pec) TaxID=298653 RepID=UPI0000540C52|nr:hypothetical protein Franean1_7001 [Frankia sp. EAN1pec]